MPPANAPEILQVKLTLRDVRPAIWRRVLVPDNFSLNRLHQAIQAAMLWLDYHLHEFEIGDKRYADLHGEGPDAYGERLYSDRNIRLRDLVDRGVDRFSYAYDFGDDWRMAVAIEKTVPAQAGVAYPPARRGRPGRPARGLRRTLRIYGVHRGARGGVKWRRVFGRRRER